MNKLFTFITQYKITHSIIIFLIILAIASTNRFEAINNAFYDFSIYMNKYNQTQDKIVLIVIDDKSLQELGRWPWERKLHAQLLDVLFKNEAQLVAFYISFFYPANEESDKTFIETLKKYPTVLIDASITSEYKQNPFWMKLSETSTLGHNFLSVGNDNTIRRKFLIVDGKPSFALSIIKMFDDNLFEYYKNLSGNNNIININFKRPSVLFTKYSYYDVLTGQFPAGAFKDKIILVAPIAKGITEYHATPLSIYDENWTSGTESVVTIQAQILDSLLNFNIIKPVNNNILYIILFVFILVLMNILFKIGIFRQVVLTFVILPAILFLTSLITFQETNIWVSPLSFLLACLLAFSTESIVVISRTSNFLDKYIKELSGQYRNNVNLRTDTSVDSKLESLKTLTDVISADKDVLDTVLTSVNSIIMLFNKEGTVVYTNHPVYNKFCFNIIELSDDINLKEIITETSERITYKTKVQMKFNHYNFFVTVAKGNLYVGILNDITDMVKMNEMKTNMLRMLSHEFKTPLTTIMLCADYLSGLIEKEYIQKYIEKITAQTIFLEEMIDDFLTLNKLEVSEFEITKDKNNLHLFIDNIVNNLKVIADNKNISIEYFFDENIPDEIPIDSKYLHIALKNLIDNAIKYSPENTSITVSAKHQKEYITICIEDQGFGISTEDQKRLFEKFYRIKNDRTTGIKGTGLGLSFVKRIIELHGGEILVESEINKGSKFIIYLPFNND